MEVDRIVSRSKKKNAITGITTATSEKFDKQNTNRRMRRKAKVLLENEEYDAIPIDTKEIEDVWCFAKDGKVRWDETDKFYEKAKRK